MKTNVRAEPNVVLARGLNLMMQLEDLEPTSAFKEAAHENGYEFGTTEMREVVEYCLDMI